MASIKNLKKDIDCLTFSVIGDCINYSAIAGKNDERVGSIVVEMVNFRNQLRQRAVDGIHVPENERKAYYKAIFKDLLVNVDTQFTKLSEVVKEG